MNLMNYLASTTSLHKHRPTFYIALPLLSSTLPLAAQPLFFLRRPRLPCPPQGIGSGEEEKAGAHGHDGDGVQSGHSYHRRPCHPPLLPGIGSEEPTGVGLTSPQHLAGAGASTALRGPRGAPGRGRPVPHLPQLPAEDGSDQDLPEPGQQYRRRHHHLRPQGLGVRSAQEVHLLQPHRRPAQEAALLPRLSQVLLAGHVQEPQRAQPGEHLRRIALHAQPHRQHGNHLRPVHVVQAQDLQQRLRHRPRRRLLHRQGAPAHAALQQEPAARAGAGTRAAVRSVGSRPQSQRRQRGRERQGGLDERRLPRRRQRAAGCRGRWLDAPLVMREEVEGDIASA